MKHARTYHKRAAAQRAGEKIDAREMAIAFGDATLEEKLILDLARAFQAETDGWNYVCVSWTNQERAVAIVNKQGFVEALDLLVKIRAATGYKED